MNGGKNKQSLGYTIIEVLIVLAVSGVMFVIAAQFINGKQEKTTFTTSINEVDSQMQNTIEQVTDGQYSDVLLNCTFSPAPPTTTINTGTSTQGTSSECVFLGKIMRFIPTTNPPTYRAISLAGGRLDASPNPVAGPVNISAADPTVVGQLTTTNFMPASLDIKKITVIDASGASFTSSGNSGAYNFGFAQSLGSNNGTGSYSSGAQTVSMIWTPNPFLSSPGDPDGNISGHVAYAQKATLCVTDGTQDADIIVGNNNSQMSVKIQRFTPGVSC